jgi:thiaminase/transcriptional activator TenA
MSHLASQLWQENADLAQACLHCAFVRGLSDGTLPRRTFKAYIAQDAYFLEAFARAYAMAAVRSRDRESLQAFTSLQAGAIEELTLHGSYAARWEVDLRNVVPGAATLAYTDFLTETAATGTVGEICAAMAPCMRLYAFLGQTLAAESSGRTHDYSEWIATYGSASFEHLAQQLEALLDPHGTGNEKMARRFRRAMQLELGFFEAHQQLT